MLTMCRAEVLQSWIVLEPIELTRPARRRQSDTSFYDGFKLDGSFLTPLQAEDVSCSQKVERQSQFCILPYPCQKGFAREWVLALDKGEILDGAWLSRMKEFETSQNNLRTSANRRAEMGETLKQRRIARRIVDVQDEALTSDQDKQILQPLVILASRLQRLA